MSLGNARSERAIVLATDERFARPAAVTLRSAFRNCEHSSMRAIVLDCGITDASRKLLETAWPGRLEIPSVDPELFRSFAADRPLAELARLALERYTDQARGRVLYLDSDLLVRKSLEPLFDHALHGFILGAVPALSRTLMGQDCTEPWPRTEYAAGGAAPGGVVFNSGVLLIDIARWRSRRVFDKALEVGTEFPVSDQRLLNSILSRDWLPLESKWNTKHPDAAIYHFASNPKPWHRNYYRNSVWPEYIALAGTLGWEIDHPPGLLLRIKARSLASRIRRQLLG